ncbi:MAG: hypothetical protein ABWY36_06090 [Leifsonia sp.]
MTDDAIRPVTLRLYHDFDQRWRAVLQDADGEDVETLVLPAEADGVRAAIRSVRHRLGTRNLDVGELTPVEDGHDAWEGPIAALAPTV